MLRTRGIFRSLVYLETLHIQNPGILRTQVYLEPWRVENSKRIQSCQTSTTKYFAKIVNSCNCFHNINFSLCLLYERNKTFLTAGLTFTPEVHILCKKKMGVEGAGVAYVYKYTLYNSKFVYWQVFIQTRSLIITSVIKPSRKYLGRVLAKRPVKN